MKTSDGEQRDGKFVQFRARKIHEKRGTRRKKKNEKHQSVDEPK